MKMKSEENSQKFDQEKEKQYRGKFHWFIILQSIFIRTQKNPLQNKKTLEKKVVWNYKNICR